MSPSYNGNATKHRQIRMVQIDGYRMALHHQHQSRYCEMPEHRPNWALDDVEDRINFEPDLFDAASIDEPWEFDRIIAAASDDDIADDSHNK